MITALEILAHLRDGEFHSGEHLGRRLGVSRAAVWKGVSRLREMGVVIHSVPGRGYKLGSDIELLDRAVLEDSLASEHRDRLDSIELFSSLASTNSHLVSSRRVDWRGPRVCLADYQSSGRGRRGRHWVSPLGANLYLSLHYPFSCGIASLGGMSLVVGIALCRLLQGCGYDGVGVKWPNDLVWRGKKLGGVLIEASGDPHGECAVVVGVGINYRMPPDVVIDQPWADLYQIAGASLLSKSILAARVIGALLSALEAFERNGFERWYGEWPGIDAAMGECVELVNGGESIVGVARGIDRHGSIAIERNGVIDYYPSGEVSLRVRRT